MCIYIHQTHERFLVRFREAMITGGYLFYIARLVFSALLSILKLCMTSKCSATCDFKCFESEQHRRHLHSHIWNISEHEI